MLYVDVMDSGYGLSCGCIVQATLYNYLLFCQVQCFKYMKQTFTLFATGRHASETFECCICEILSAFVDEIQNIFLIEHTRLFGLVNTICYS